MSNPKEISKELSPLERKILPFLTKYSALNDLIEKSGLKDVEVVRALQWLQNKEAISLTENVKELITLDDNGQTYLKKGLPEKRFLLAIGKDTSAKKAVSQIQKDAELSNEELNISIGVLKKKAAINIGKDEKGLFASITPQGIKLSEKDSFEEIFLKKTFPIDKSQLKDEEKFAFDNLIKRKGIIRSDLAKERFANITSLGKEIEKETTGKFLIERVTPEMLKKAEWKGNEFRHYDIKINVPKIYGGKKHFVNQSIGYVKKIWLEMGFTENTGPLVQTSFWDLDALFVPQDHPAREMQDTFFIKDPSRGNLPPIWKKIKDTHEQGGNTKSRGWGGKWSEKIAQQNMLITHDTYLSAKTLSGLKKADLPYKSFQIMKVFRNEALDWKHLFEFYQVGGIVVDPDANFQHLLGYLKTFFSKMGFDDVRIRPAHFPYTEPSAEIEVYHPIKKEWIELGGSGIFRPEVVEPLLGFECPVLAWGFGLERIISDYYKITDLRQVYGNDLKQLREMKSWMR